MQLVADLIVQDATTIAYSVAGLFNRASRVQDFVNQYRPPQAVFECLQDVSVFGPISWVKLTSEQLLEHSVSLSQRARNRLVHASIQLIGHHDVQTKRPTIADHLTLCGRYPVASGGYGDVYRGQCLGLSLQAASEQLGCRCHVRPSCGGQGAETAP